MIFLPGAECRMIVIRLDKTLECDGGRTDRQTDRQKATYLVCLECRGVPRVTPPTFRIRPHKIAPINERKNLKSSITHLQINFAEICDIGAISDFRGTEVAEWLKSTSGQIQHGGRGPELDLPSTVYIYSTIFEHEKWPHQKYI